MNSYRRKTRKKNKRKNKSKKIKLNNKLRLNNKFRKRYQIGCSKKSNMKGGGVSPMQAFSDVMNNISNYASNFLNTHSGESQVPSADPTKHDPTKH
jgi:hypothetical protein